MRSGTRPGSSPDGDDDNGFKVLYCMWLIPWLSTRKVNPSVTFVKPTLRLPSGRVCSMRCRCHHHVLFLFFFVDFFGLGRFLCFVCFCFLAYLLFISLVRLLDQTMSAVMNLICTIWESILPALEKTVNEPSLDLVQQTVTGEHRSCVIAVAVAETVVCSLASRTL